MKKSTLTQYAKQLGSLAGKKRLKEGGKEAFSEMGKKSWKTRKTLGKEQ